MNNSIVLQVFVYDESLQPKEDKDKSPISFYPTLKLNYFGKFKNVYLKDTAIAKKKKADIEIGESTFCTITFRRKEWNLACAVKLIAEDIDQLPDENYTSTSTSSNSIRW